jgi:hypothetical protein
MFPLPLRVLMGLEEDRLRDLERLASSARQRRTARRAGRGASRAGEAPSGLPRMRAALVAGWRRTADRCLAAPLPAAAGQPQP